MILEVRDSKEIIKTALAYILGANNEFSYTVSLFLIKFYDIIVICSIAEGIFISNIISILIVKRLFLEFFLILFFSFIFVLIIPHVLHRYLIYLFMISKNLDAKFRYMLQNLKSYFKNK